MYEHLDRVAADLIVPAVELVAQLIAAQDDPGTLQQYFQKREFFRRQSQRLTFVSDAAGRGIQAHVAILEDGRSKARAPSHHGSNSRHELVEIERFAYIVVGARVQSLDSIGNGLARREDDDWQGIALMAQLREHFQAIAIGQPEIQYGGIVAGLGADDDRRGAVIQPIHRKPLVEESAAKSPADHSIVFDQQDFHPTLREDNPTFLNASLILGA